MITLIGRILLSGVLLVPAVWGWGGKGHRIVAQIAESRLTPVAAAKVKLILGGYSMADVASWADEVRSTPEYANTYNWHFVDIPRDAKAYDKGRDCPATEKGDCIIEALIRELDALRAVDAANPTPAQVDALRFLVHFAGDLHQPFHGVSDYRNGLPDGDRGGNRVIVTLFGQANNSQQRPWNLHAVWDDGLMSALRPPESEYLKQMLKAAPASASSDGPITLDRSMFIAWAMESHDLAVQAYVPNGTDLDAGYCEPQAKIMDQRIQVAGVRLGAVLNQLLGSQP